MTEKNADSHKPALMARICNFVRDISTCDSGSTMYNEMNSFYIISFYGTCPDEQLPLHLCICTCICI